MGSRIPIFTVFPVQIKPTPRIDAVTIRHDMVVTVHHGASVEVKHQIPVLITYGSVVWDLGMFNAGSPLS
ncbi:MAG: hypothetical protein IPG79_07155 [Saprospiraceae bacterium]|nr:hypothetical protein [Saprospiraceae bacterium]